MEISHDIVIVGAGLAGLATSLGLHRLGIKCLVLEGSESLRITGFALTTWTNAWKVFDGLGVGETLRDHHVQIDGVIATSVVTGLGGHRSLQGKASNGDHEVRCQKRKTLLEALASELPDGTIRFSSKVVAIEESGYYKLVRLADGTTVKTKALIGCDGVNSVVGKHLGFKKPLLTGRVAIRGIANFKEEHGYGNKFQQVFGKGYRSGFLPCDAKSIYWFFTWTPSTPDEMVLDSSAKMKQIVLRRLEDGIGNPYLKNVIETTEVENIDSAPLGFRVPMELIWANISKDNVCVAGDALHPMTPDVGQGGCCSLEDGFVLARCLAEALKTRHNGEDKDEEKAEYERIVSGLQKYANERRWRSFDLVTTSYLVGVLLESDNLVLKFLREKVLGQFLGGLLLKRADYDFGKLCVT